MRKQHRKAHKIIELTEKHKRREEAALVIDAAARLVDEGRIESPEGRQAIVHLVELDRDYAAVLEKMLLRADANRQATLACVGQIAYVDSLEKPLTRLARDPDAPDAAKVSAANILKTRGITVQPLLSGSVAETEAAVFASLDQLFEVSAADPSVTHKWSQQIAELDHDVARVMLKHVAEDPKQRGIPLLKQVAFDGPEPLSATALELLGAMGSAAAADALIEIADAAQGTALRKQAKKALYHLKLSGIAVDAFRPQVETSVDERPEVRFESAWTLECTSYGNFFALLAVRRKGTGLFLIRCMWSDGDGLLGFSPSLESKREMLGLIAEVMRDTLLVPMNPEHLRQLLAESAALRRAAGNKLPVDYAAWRDAIESGQPRQPHPVREILVSPSSAPSALLPESAEVLLATAEMKNWTIPQDIFEPYAAELRSAVQGGLAAVAPDGRSTAAPLVESAVNHCLDSTQRRLFSQRLEHMAWFFLHSERYREAETALAVADVLTDDSVAPASIVFMAELAARTIQSMTAPTDENEGAPAPILHA